MMVIIIIIIIIIIVLQKKRWRNKKKPYKKENICKYTVFCMLKRKIRRKYPIIIQVPLVVFFKSRSKENYDLSHIII